MVFGGEQSLGEVDREDLATFQHVLVMLFRIVVIDDYPFSTLREIDEFMTAVLVISFLVITAVIGLNLFIAMLSDTFKRVYDNAHANAEMQKVRLK